MPSPRPRPLISVSNWWTWPACKLEDEAIAAVPRHIAKRYRVVPLYRHGNSLAVVMSDPSDLNTIDTLNHLLNAELEIKVASEEEIDAALNKYYGARPTTRWTR